MEEETLVDGQATDSFGSILELTGDSRRDVNDDGVDDAVLEFTCTTLASLTDITVVLDGSRPAQMEVLDRTSRLR